MPISQIVTNSIANGAVGATQTATTNQFYGFKNRVINGQMQIDQRNNGASISITNSFGFPVDRFIGVTAASTTVAFQRSTVAPAGFTNSLISTVTTPKSMAAADLNRIIYRIEGLNVSDLGFGTANAQPITLSFWVRASVTGTYNIAFVGGQSYLASYTISAANTWEYKTISIFGSTSGTWPTDNTTGLEINFTLGAGSDWVGTAGSWISSTARFAVSGAANFIGTNGATFYITGVQLEKGSTATSFDYRPYGTELALCQRYYTKTYQQNIVPGTAANQLGSIWAVQPTTNSYPWIGTWNYPVTMRATPTVTLYRPSDGVVNGFNGDSGNYTGATITASGERSVSVFGNNVSISTTMFMSVHAAASAEL